MRCSCIFSILPGVELQAAPLPLHSAGSPGLHPHHLLPPREYRPTSPVTTIALPSALPFILTVTWSSAAVVFPFQVGSFDLRKYYLYV